MKLDKQKGLLFVLPLSCHVELGLIGQLTTNSALTLKLRATRTVGHGPRCQW